MDSTRSQARRAGLLYVLVLVAGVFGLIYAPSRLIVAGEASATADRLRAGQTLLRLGVASNLLGQLLILFLALALYRLFKPVDRGLAQLLLVLGALVEVPIAFLDELHMLAAGTLAAAPPFLSAFDRPQLDALAYLFVHLHARGFEVAAIFWGLWLFPFGLLVLRSRFIPGWIGVALLAAGAGYLLSSFATFVLPAIQPVTDRVGPVLRLGELPIVFWLLIWGARPQGTAAAAPRAEAT